MKHDGKTINFKVQGGKTTATIRGIGKKQLQHALEKMKPRAKWTLTVESNTIWINAKK